MHRRTLLRWGLLSSAGVLAGCSSPFRQHEPSDHKPQLEVFVTNALESSIRVTVTATRGSTELFSEAYALGPGEGDESKSFVGLPTDVRVSIRDDRTVTRDYAAPASCDPPELNITVEPDEVLVTNGCVNA